MNQSVHFEPSDVFQEKAERTFLEQKELLKSKLPYADIQHVGGTAVPGLLTKGDLDINVRVSADQFRHTVEVLNAIYEEAQTHNWTNTFAIFKDDTLFELPVGIQVTVIGSSEDYFVKHRDVLRNDPALVTAFNKVKEEYEGKDMEEYRSAKQAFLQSQGLC